MKKMLSCCLLIDGFAKWIFCRQQVKAGTLLILFGNARTCFDTVGEDGGEDEITYLPLHCLEIFRADVSFLPICTFKKESVYLLSSG